MIPVKGMLRKAQQPPLLLSILKEEIPARMMLKLKFCIVVFATQIFIL